MGITRFAGPVYGAKCLLLSAAVSTAAKSLTDSEILQYDVPSDEDWYITNVTAYCTAIDAGAGAIDVEDDGTSVLSASITLAANDAVEGTIVATGGEDEGKLVAGGSSITVDLTTGATTFPANVQVLVHGYIRAGATKKAGAVA